MKTTRTRLGGVGVLALLWGAACGDSAADGGGGETGGGGDTGEGGEGAGANSVGGQGGAPLGGAPQGGEGGGGASMGGASAGGEAAGGGGGAPPVCSDGELQICYSGPGGTAGVGVCAAGTRTCSAGTFGACSGEILPTGELCNGLDDDCDGAADEGDPGAGVACSTALPGACATGTTVCTGPSGVACAPDIAPGALAETCNTIDDDCDGEQDEDWPFICDASHPAAQQVTAWSCAPGGCVPTCSAGWADSDGLLGNGCECAINEAAASCGAATTAPLDIYLGGNYPQPGTLPSPGDEDWRWVLFSPDNPTLQYGKFTLSDDAGGTFRMDVMTTCGTFATCLGGGVAQNVPQCTVTAPADYRVRIYRADPSIADCNDSFTMTVSLYAQ